MAAVRKWDMLASKVKNEQRWKKGNENETTTTTKKQTGIQATNFFVSQYDTPFTWTTEGTVFTTLLPPPKKKKLLVTILSSFSWILQSSQEKSKTMVMHKVHYVLCKNGEFTHLCLKISGFLSFQSDIKFNFYCSNLTWHSKMPLTLLGLLEPPL